MKRRLALLLALTLTFASFPVAGAAAAETEPVETQVVTEVSEENEMVPAEETVQTDDGEEATGESGQEAVSEEEQDENQDAAGAAEGAEEGETAEAAGEGMTDEAAPVEEPGEGTTEEAAVVDEKLIDEEAKKAEEAKNGFVVENGCQ